MMIDYREFYKEEVEPRLFPLVGMIFPEYDFKKNDRGDTWQSSHRLDGSPHGRKDKTVCKNPAAANYGHIRFLEQGGESKSLMDLYMMKTGKGFVDAMKALAAMAGVDVPQGSYNAEKYESHRQKQARLQAILVEMKKALYTPQGEEVLQYLRGRGYNDEEIQDMPIGYIDYSMPFFQELRGVLLHMYLSSATDTQTGQQQYLGVGNTHKLAIAYIANGDIQGFHFRTILTEEQMAGYSERCVKMNHQGEQEPVRISKYLAAYTAENNTQKYYPLCLPTGTLSAYNDPYDKNFTLVEGALDTYRGTQAGVHNLVGISQGGVTMEQLQALKRKGAEAITILKDTEAQYKADGSSNIESIKHSEDAARNAIRLIKAQGLKAYVCYLPSPDGSKVDIDSYLKGLHGDDLRAKGEEIQALIDNADSGNVFLYKLLQRDTPRDTAKGREDFSHKVVSLSLESTEAEQAEIIRLVREQDTDLAEAIRRKLNDCYTPQEVQERHEQGQRKREEREAAIKQYKIAARKSINTIEEDYEGTVSAMKQKLDTMPSSADDDSDLKEYTRIKSQEERKKAQEETPIGVHTGYTFFSRDTDDKGRYSSSELLLPAAALTYVCAPSGHGKTRLLENLAMQVLDNESNGDTGSVLFFTLEEDNYKIENAFLNIYVSRNLNSEENNIITLKRYKAAKLPSEQAALFDNTVNYGISYGDFLQQERAFNEDYILNGRLRIYYEPGGSMAKIERVIRYLSKTLTEEDGKPIKAVFIDYIQRLKGNGDYHGDKKQEMDAVTTDLMKLSVEMAIPFVLSVQLNRQTTSPLDMEISKIADAAEIERSGNVILCCWNTAYRPSRNNSDWGGKNLSDEATEFESRVIPLGKDGRGKLYATIAKNRDGEKDLEAVLYFNGNTGLIKQDSRKVEEVQALRHRETAKERKAREQAEAAEQRAKLLQNAYYGPEPSSDEAILRLPDGSRGFRSDTTSTEDDPF